MPKLIDHSARRAEFAEAVWRIALRDGVSAISVRDVAAEAGVSVGSLRHVVDTKAELLEIASEHIYRKVEARLSAPRDRSKPLSWAVEVLSELLPLDRERQIEWEASLALQAEAPAAPKLAQIAEQGHHEVRFVCASVIAELNDAQLLGEGSNLDDLTDGLHAFIDGLALHTARAAQAAAPRALELLGIYLHSIARTAP